jgi:hypothetical protein
MSRPDPNLVAEVADALMRRDHVAADSEHVVAYSDAAECVVEAARRVGADELALALPELPEAALDALRKAGLA